MFDFFRAEPLYHYPMDRFSIISPILYRPEHCVVHVGGGPGRNHPREINLNVFPLTNVDIVGNAERLPLGDESVDVVISNAVLEHVRDLSATIGEINRVLKPGGFVYIEIPFMQVYHTHDAHGVRFEDYRRLTRAGLVDTLDFCAPLDVGVCVGPISAIFQMLFSFVRNLSSGQTYGRLVERAYYFVGNLFVWLDAFLSNATIERSAIPSGIYFFGRKPDAMSAWLDRQPRPNSAFPRSATAEITLGKQTAGRIVFRIRNTSETMWLKASELSWGTVHVGLQRKHAGTLDRDFRRLELPGDIAPGHAFDMSFDRGILGDADAVTIDLVIEGICWFADRGNRPLVIPLPGR
jgi:hypothetical protein